MRKRKLHPKRMPAYWAALLLDYRRNRRAHGESWKEAWANAWYYTWNIMPWSITTDEKYRQPLDASPPWEDDGATWPDT